MRLLVFIGTMRAGGAERVTARLCDALVDRGHAVTLVTLSGADGDAYAVSVKVLRRGLDIAGTKRGIGKVFAILRRVKALRSEVRRAKPDTVLAMMQQESLMAIIACVGLGVRVVVSERSAFWMRRRPRTWSWLFRHMYRFSDAQVAPTREIAQRVVKETGAHAQHVIPNAVDLPVVGRGASIDPSSVVPAGAPFILVIGSKPQTKGFDHALDAFRAMASVRTNWHLVFLGLLPDHEWARKIEAGCDLAKHVHVVPSVGNVQDWYHQAALFVLSSRTEGMPNALMEAMASGCPCIAYDCPTGPADLIEHGTNGLLVPAQDKAALAAALAVLADDPGMRHRIGQAARSVSSEFSLKKTVDAWEMVLFSKNEISVIQEIN